MGVDFHRRPTAFSSKVDTGSRQENAIKQRSRVLSDSAESEGTSRDCLKSKNRCVSSNGSKRRSGGHRPAKRPYSTPFSFVATLPDPFRSGIALDERESAEANLEKLHRSTPDQLLGYEIDVGLARLTSSFHFSRRRSPFARQEPLHRTRILPKPRRLRRFSISDARFALFNIKRDIARYYAI